MSRLNLNKELFTMKRIYITSFIAASLLAISCNNDDDGPTPFPVEPEVVAPETYSFERDGESTVSFSGQSTRIAMAQEFITALKVSDNTETMLDGMFAHVEGEADFSNADLNASDKSIRSKVAASTDFFAANTTDANAIKSTFDDWIAEQVDDVFPNWGTQAAAGTSGFLVEFDGSTTRYVNGKGVEIDQVITKSLIGGLMTDQMLNNYLGVAVLNAGTNVSDNDEAVLDGDSNYTTMEHKWDEAYGYLYGAEADTAAPTFDDDVEDSFLNKYLGRVIGDPDFTTFGDEIYEAFKLGRAAIVANNYEVRDEQAQIIRDRVSQIIGIRAVYYLKSAEALLNAETVDYASAFHDLGEGLGFVYSLQFTRIPNTNESYFSKEEVDGYFSDLLDEGNGLWEESTADKLGAMADEIAEKFDFTVAQAEDTSN